jgi:proteasome lid subunit RPN8/RPN11
MAHATDKYGLSQQGVPKLKLQRHDVEEFVGVVRRYIPCENTATDPNEEFRIAPEDYAAAEDMGEVMGIVHSHPDATSRPSPRDLAICEATELP